MNNKVLNIGHRGARDLVFENTLESIDAGIKAGADIIEIDVRGTRDNIPIVLHDPNLKRIVGINGKPIKKIEYNELKKTKTKSNLVIPTLDEALSLISNRSEVLLDIKDKSVVPAILKKLSEKKINSAYLFYDDPRVLKYIRDRNSRIRLGALFHAILTSKAMISNINSIVYRTPLITFNYLRLYKDISPYFLNIGRFIASKRFINFCHKKGLRVFVWQNIKSQRQMEKLIDHNVDGIITDRPDILSEVLKSSNNK